MARKLGSHGTYVEARAFNLTRRGARLPLAFTLLPGGGRHRADLRCGRCQEVATGRRTDRALDFAGSAFVVVDCPACGITNALKDRHGNYVRHGNPNPSIVLRGEELTVAA